MNASPKPLRHAELGSLDWRAVLRQIATSRALDDLEESTLLPQRMVLYQFSARGHELTQVLLGHNSPDPKTGWVPIIGRVLCV
jgi:2-oxoisovalerate dehydrogenase E1 component